jgi:hypothetical protein
MTSMFYLPSISIARRPEKDFIPTSTMVRQSTKNAKTSSLDASLENAHKTENHAIIVKTSTPYTLSNQELALAHNKRGAAPVVTSNNSVPVAKGAVRQKAAMNAEMDTQS